MLLLLNFSLCAGEAYFQFSDGTREYFIKNQTLPDGARAFTGRSGTTIILKKEIELSLGKRTVIQRLDEKGSTMIFLSKGRLRVKSEGESLKVKTPVVEVKTGKGSADIIIANLNCMAVSREGEGLRIATSKKIQDIPVNHYVLVTVEGSIIVNAPDSHEGSK